MKHLENTVQGVMMSDWSLYSSHIDRLGDLKVDWNSYGSDPPNELAVSNAHAILDLLQYVNTMPTRIAPVADEGIILWLDKHNSIECLNSGAIEVEVEG